MPGLRAGFEPVESASAKFDLCLSLAEQLAADGSPAGLAGVLEYASDLFDQAGAQALAGRLIRLLEAAVGDADAPIGRLDILAPDERHRILRAWNDTARAIPRTTLPALFAAQAADSPQAIAVVCEDAAAELSRTRCALQPARASSARARGRPRDRGRALPGALAPCRC